MTTVGILGGGQLGRMIALAGYPLGLSFRFLDPSPNAPVHDLGDHIVAEYDDPQALSRFVDGVDVATYEFENVPAETARLLAQSAPVYPPAIALDTAQDRFIEKRFFNSIGIPTPRFLPVDDRATLDAAVGEIGLPSVLKTRREGYDGKGQVVLREAADLDRAWDTLGGRPLILEAFVPFDREVSMIAARGRDGAVVTWPLVEIEQRDGILHRAFAPARETGAGIAARARQHVQRALAEMEYVGVLTIEFFVRGDDLLGNEMAPRVHNSGHWTIEGAITSQFENHLRAILGLPLGSTEARAPSVMVNLIGSTPPAEKLLALRGAHLHLYGKTPRAGRKVGHVTLVAPDEDAVRRLVALADDASRG
jgi:5-(carboxyamino)imidazole ribonucleotide synthase